MTYLPQGFEGGEPGFAKTEAWLQTAPPSSDVDEALHWWRNRISVAITRVPPGREFPATRTEIELSLGSTTDAVEGAEWLVGRYRVTFHGGTPLLLSEVERIADGLRIEE
jgi:hypothetical protein